MKNRIMRLLSAAGVAAALTLATAQTAAQDNNPQGGGQGGQGGGQGGGRRNRGGGGPGGGNFDPEAFRQQMSDRMKEQFGVKDDAEWKLIMERVDKVNEARREMGGGRGMFGMMGRGPGGPGGAPAAAPGGDPNAGGGRRGGGGFGGTPSPEAETLQKAIDANAPADEIKTKLAKYRTVQKDKQAKLDKAQDELRQVLSVKQEAQAVLLGILK